MLTSHETMRSKQELHADQSVDVLEESSGTNVSPEVGCGATIQMNRSQAARHFQEQAARCFRLADCLVVRGDRERLLEIGYELEMRAAQAEKGEP